LIDQAADILVVSKFAGRSLSDITLRVYGHLLDDGVERAAEKYDPLAVEAS
jgi:hypothetical protein